MQIRAGRSRGRPSGTATAPPATSHRMSHVQQSVSMISLSGDLFFSGTPLVRRVVEGCCASSPRVPHPPAEASDPLKNWITTTRGICARVHPNSPLAARTASRSRNRQETPFFPGAYSRFVTIRQAGSRCWQTASLDNQPRSPVIFNDPRSISEQGSAFEARG